jgi:hypothetical protein
MTRETILRTALWAFLLFVSFSAYADVVGPGPENCPVGSTAESTHTADFCSPSACKTDSDCEGGDVCQESSLCIGDFRMRVHTSILFAPPKYTTIKVATGACSGTKKCKGDSSCITKKYCVPKGTPKSSSKKENAKKENTSNVSNWFNGCAVDPSSDSGSFWGVFFFVMLGFIFAGLKSSARETLASLLRRVKSLISAGLHP